MQKELSTNVAVENMHVLGHGTVRIVIGKSAVDFGTFHKVKFDQILKQNCFSRVFSVISISEFSEHGWTRYIFREITFVRSNFSE